jgi:hypothetical protein
MAPKVITPKPTHHHDFYLHKRNPVFPLIDPIKFGTKDAAVTAHDSMAMLSHPLVTNLLAKCAAASFGNLFSWQMF